ncbi:MAG: ADP-ribose pyrophosphatase [Candidatus Nanosalina sp. J07AB43]|jgi:ADP-ribose pyrophosphatase|nr:MAG: ADP-ribose pyrophosphatase [Candidatus Nanosalina sp. J07AB43]
MDKPLTVAVAVVIKHGEILMIQRDTGDYDGYWALPGGKVEQGEHVSECAMREIKEEADIDTEFTDYLGLVSEVFGGKQFMLHIVELETDEKIVSGSREGQVNWVDIDSLGELDVVPSDLEVIEQLVGGDGGYFECLMKESDDGDHILENFEKRGDINKID